MRDETYFLNAVTILKGQIMTNYDFMCSICCNSQLKSVMLIQYSVILFYYLKQNFSIFRKTCIHGDLKQNIFYKFPPIKNSTVIFI